jgi:pimeloyl-ACP methyl ester carboxylesterase
MDRLGYSRYGAQGGDWGSAVTTALGAQDAAHCAGIHVTLVMAARPNVEGQPTPEEARALKGIAYYTDWDTGYSKQQSTRPQTLGYGLTDSPSGQAAWILEKFWAWTDCDGHPENILLRTARQRHAVLGDGDRGFIGAALLGELWAEATHRTGSRYQPGSGFPKEIVTPVRKWMEPNQQHPALEEMPKGGHFAAFSSPDLLSPGVEFFRICVSTQQPRRCP